MEQKPSALEIMCETKLLLGLLWQYCMIEARNKPDGYEHYFHPSGQVPNTLIGLMFAEEAVCPNSITTTPRYPPKASNDLDQLLVLQQLNF